MNRIQIGTLRRENIPAIIEWNTGRDADFLQQWSGRGYAYPLTAAQIEGHLAEGAEVFEILRDGAMIGTIELMSRKENGAGHIGRFLLDPTQTARVWAQQLWKPFWPMPKRSLP